MKPFNIVSGIFQPAKKKEESVEEDDGAEAPESAAAEEEIVVGQIVHKAPGDPDRAPKAEPLLEEALLVKFLHKARLFL